MRKIIQKLFSRIALIGADVNDDEDARLKKALLVICAFPFMFAGAIWGLMYIFFGEVLAGLIPMSYAVFSFFSILHFKYTKRFAIFRFSQLLLILLLPFALMTALGGFINGSAVILWGVICPLGALLIDKPKNAIWWFAAFTGLMILSGVLQTRIALENDLSAGQINLFFVINLLGVASLIFLMVSYFVQRKNYFQERSEALLLNILPKEIADILRKETRTIADHFENASILFADVVNFTPMSANMTAKEIVNLLNEVFSEFDNLADKYGLEKIKTIGDCYMAAAGVPRPRPDHAHAITRMAIDMRNFIKDHKFGGRHIQFRFGINSGSLVAGVIGRKKFIYDLWGDAVNIASRMESQGYKDAIQITQHTYDLIKDDFDCEYKGSIEVKGKGAMNVWFVTGLKNQR